MNKNSMPFLEMNKNSIQILEMTKIVFFVGLFDQDSISYIEHYAKTIQNTHWATV
jgi:hypothetical protein